MNESTFDDLPDPAKTSLEDYLTATAKRARAIWKQHHPGRNVQTGRPSQRLIIVEACERLAKQRQNDFSNLTLGKIVQIISGGFPATSKNISGTTLSKHAREWLVEGLISKRFSLDQLPVGLAPYLFKSQNSFALLRWIVCWGAICREQPEVQKWVKEKLGMLPPELPHEVLPEKFKKRYKNWESQYDQWVLGGLLKAQKKPRSSPR